jgi:hypothetical protein
MTSGDIPPYSHFRSARRAQSSIATFASLVLFTLVVPIHSLATASTMYWRYVPLCAGDTVAVSDLNDQGVLLLNGFQSPNGASATGVPASCDRQFFRNHGGGPPLFDPYDGVRVTDINNAGDALGYAIRPDGMSVPTIWIGGVPYDLTAPSNAGLHFNHDPGPKAINNFDLWSLPIVGLPFTPGDISWVSTFAYTNARNDYVFNFSTAAGLFDFYGYLTAVVPEPGTLLLLLSGIAAASLVARGRLH